jgi:hypothetical protein
MVDAMPAQPRAPGLERFRAKWNSHEETRQIKNLESFIRFREMVT